MKLSLIWAMDRNRLIGNHDALPWHLPADMQWFRKQTMGKPILMGRKTFESIGKPLPKRINIILSRQKTLTIEGCIVVQSLDEAKAAVPDANEIMVIGGAEIYTLLLPQADQLYITHIDARFEGDTWFPTYDLGLWQRVQHESHQADEKNPHNYHFEVWQRNPLQK
ncbi:MAG: type 3 dihydrofolate reductase [Proteobacteria bacterium]|nr:MAG: type 3 dihydrofolate reductase [Pseudomonadota bacterium]